MLPWAPRLPAAPPLLWLLLALLVAPGRVNGDHQVEYVMLKGSTEGCPQGAEITSEEECGRAIQALGLQAYPAWVGVTDDIPRYCSYNRNHESIEQEYMQWNPGPRGNGKKELSPVCKAMPGSDLAIKLLANQSHEIDGGAAALAWTKDDPSPEVETDQQEENGQQKPGGDKQTEEEGGSHDKNEHEKVGYEQKGLMELLQEGPYIDILAAIAATLLASCLCCCCWLAVCSRCCRRDGYEEVDEGDPHTVWEWESKEGWIMFDHDATHLIEQGFQQYKFGGPPRAMVDSNSLQLLMDYKAMTSKAVSSGAGARVRNIRRTVGPRQSSANGMDSSLPHCLLAVKECWASPLTCGGAFFIAVCLVAGATAVHMYYTVAETPVVIAAASTALCVALLACCCACLAGCLFAKPPSDRELILDGASQASSSPTRRSIDLTSELSEALNSVRAADIEEGNLSSMVVHRPGGVTLAMEGPIQPRHQNQTLDISIGNDNATTEVLFRVVMSENGQTPGIMIEMADRIPVAHVDTRQCVGPGGPRSSNGQRYIRITRATLESLREDAIPFAIVKSLNQHEVEARRGMPNGALGELIFMVRTNSNGKFLNVVDADSMLMASVGIKDPKGPDGRQSMQLRVGVGVDACMVIAAVIAASKLKS